MQLHAVIRPNLALDDGARSRVAIIGPPAAGGRPRANLDGMGEREVAAFYVAEQLPASVQHIARMRDMEEALSAAGYRVAGAWTVGVDPHGRYASVRVDRVATPAG